MIEMQREEITEIRDHQQTAVASSRIVLAVRTMDLMAERLVDRLTTSVTWTTIF